MAAAKDGGRLGFEKSRIPLVKKRCVWASRPVGLAAASAAPRPPPNVREALVSETHALLSSGLFSDIHT